MSGSSIHLRLSEVNGVDQSITGSKHNIPFTISGKGSKHPTNTRVQRDMSNKSNIYRKHIWNNEIYLC
ncbi:hypothetical protein B296_00016180 [Ensete ventricosum]|uniref:Uncharacterized protein n=1 Tax=Ensete ventricosum TaxID=4639 RepID=A0A426YKB4_ENSVE|nr:hypothetical protein B296_00016180 [Ensete ventricosum]